MCGDSSQSFGEKHSIPGQISASGDFSNAKSDPQLITDGVEFTTENVNRITVVKSCNDDDIVSDDRNNKEKAEVNISNSDEASDDSISAGKGDDDDNISEYSYSSNVTHISRVSEYDDCVSCVSTEWDDEEDNTVSAVDYDLYHYSIGEHFNYNANSAGDLALVDHEVNDYENGVFVDRWVTHLPCVNEEDEEASSSDKHPNDTIVNGRVTQPPCDAEQGKDEISGKKCDKSRVVTGWDWITKLPSVMEEDEEDMTSKESDNEDNDDAIQEELLEGDADESYHCDSASVSGIPYEKKEKVSSGKKIKKFFLAAGKRIRKFFAKKTAKVGCI